MLPHWRILTIYICNTKLKQVNTIVKQSPCQHMRTQKHRCNNANWHTKHSHQSRDAVSYALNPTWMLRNLTWQCMTILRRPWWVHKHIQIHIPLHAIAAAVDWSRLSHHGGQLQPTHPTINAKQHLGGQDYAQVNRANRWRRRSQSGSSLWRHNTKYMMIIWPHMEPDSNLQLMKTNRPRETYNPCRTYLYARIY